MFKKLLALGIVTTMGCTAPQNKSASLEYLRDSRDFSTVSVYGGAEIAPQARFFGNLDLNSPFNKAETADLTRFNGRARLVRPVYGDFGLTAEYKTASDDNNDIGGVGVSCSPIKGLEFRVYPFRTDKKNQEACLSFGKVFEAGKFDPYFRGFFDVGEKDGKDYSLGEVQIGLKAESGWRIAVEIRYSDFDQRSGYHNPGMAGGLGVDF